MTDIDSLLPLEAHIEHRDLTDRIVRWDKAYHGADAPEVPDDVYDAARRRLLALEARFPELAAKSPVSRAIGAAPAEGFGTVRHRMPMLSLDNAFSAGDVIEFDGTVRRFLGLELAESPAYVAEPKIDGLSINLRYERGELVQARSEALRRYWKLKVAAGETA